MTTRILVWDWPVRISHWAMAIAFAVAYLSAESERWRMVHVISGCTVFAIVLFRLLWGVVGSKYAQFKNFMHSPMRALEYVRSLLNGKKIHYLGHNPAGAWSVLALLLCLLFICGTGLWLYRTTSSTGTMSQWHEAGASTAVTLVGVHMVGVAVSSFWGKENLIRSMLDGYKVGVTTDAIPKAYGFVAIAVLFWVVFFVYFWS